MVAGRTTGRIARAERAEQAARRPTRRKLEADRRLHDAVAAVLARDWSLEQIAGRLRVDHPDGEAIRVSHETISQALYLQARGRVGHAVEAGAAHRPGRTRPPRQHPAQSRPGSPTWSKSANARRMSPTGHWKG